MNRNKATILVIGIILILVGGWLGLRIFLEVDSPFYVVSSGSMVPNLERGDGVIIRNGEGFSFSDVVIGDIIVFSVDDGGIDRTIIHRVVEIYFSEEEEEDQRILKTKGDANPQSYEGLDYPITEEDYYGKVISVIPKIGAFRYLGS